MKVYIRTVISICVFIVITVFAIEMTTSLRGKPTRGVGYGIGVHYLAVALTIVGSLTVILAHWLNRTLILAIGMTACLICVIVLFPQPSLSVRASLGLLISSVLAASVLFVHKVSNRA